jgi:hypothetical protein
MSLKKNKNRFSTLFMMVLFFVIFVHYTGINALHGQTIAGKWRDSQYNANLELTASGTYSLQYPNGQSTGRFGINGNILWMQDASGGQPVYYTIITMTNDLIILQDANGMRLNYRRVQPQVPGQPAPSGKQPKASSTPGRTLVSKNGFTLTSAHIDTGVGLIQFIIGKTIKAKEVKELEAQSIVEFNRNPSYFIQEINSLSQSLQTLRSFTEPVRIGLARQQLFAALYQATYQMQEKDKPLMIQVINRYIKVLAHDPANGLVLTDKDAEGMTKYLAFNSELMGQKIALSDQLVKSVALEMARNFFTMPLEQKQLLCSASLVWQLLEANWNQLSSAQKQQYKSSFQAQIAQNFNPSSYTYSSPPATGGKKTTADAMREYRSRQHMMQMMNEMNMNTHALSLNIIENIGGTGNYWNVVDY